MSRMISDYGHIGSRSHVTDDNDVSNDFVSSIQVLFVKHLESTRKDIKDYQFSGFFSIITFY